MFAVLKLARIFESTNYPLPIRLDDADGCVGLIPVFKTRKQAERNAEGVFSIVEIVEEERGTEG